MKIAVPVTDTDQIDDHFGHCQFYNIFSISNKNQIEIIETLPSEQGCGCKSGIAEVLAAHGVTILLAGSIGKGAINVLNNSGIQVIRGCSGSVNQNVEQYLKGSISDSGLTCRQHESDAEHLCSH